MVGCALAGNISTVLMEMESCLASPKIKFFLTQVMEPPPYVANPYPGIKIRMMSPITTYHLS